MTFEHVVEMYQRGELTKWGFVPTFLAVLDEDNVARALTSIPPQAADELWSFVLSYDPSAERISFGGCPCPTLKQIELARRWLKENNGSISEFIRGLPPGSLTKQQIDQQVRDERSDRE